MRRADEKPGAPPGKLDECVRVLERRREGLLDEHVLAGLERRPRQRGVLVHAGQHEDDVDIIRTDHALRARRSGRRRTVCGAVPLPFVDVVHGAHVTRPRARSRSIMPTYGPAKTLPQPRTPIPRLMSPPAQRRSTRQPRPGVDVEASLDAESGGERDGGRERGDRAQPRVREISARGAEHRGAAGGADRLGLLEQRVATVGRLTTRWPLRSGYIADVAPSRVSTPSAGIPDTSFKRRAPSSAPAQACRDPKTIAGVGLQLGEILGPRLRRLDRGSDDPGAT